MYNLMLIEFLQHITGGTQVITRVKLTGLFSKNLADSSCHGKTTIAVDVYLAYR